MVNIDALHSVPLTAEGGVREEEGESVEGIFQSVSAVLFPRLAGFQLPCDSRGYCTFELEG
jgi:hypothetical protein